MGLRLHFGSCASESGPSDGVNEYGTQGLQGPGQAILAVRTAGQVCIPVPRCFGGRSSTVIHSAAIVGTMAASILFIAIAVLVYFAATMLQTFWSERDILKFVSSRRVRNFIEVKPKTFTGQWK